MSRWKWILIPCLALGLTGGLLALGIGRTRASGVYTPKQLKKFWKEEAKRPLPPPLPRSERERQAEEAVQMIKDMCDVLRQSPISLRAFAERFGTDIESYRPVEVWFQSRARAFQQPKSSAMGARVSGPPGRADDVTLQPSIEEDEADQLHLADIERGLGKGRVVEDGLYGSVEFFWPPGAEEPPLCRITVEPNGLLSNTPVVIGVIRLEPGSYDDEGNFWPVGQVPKGCLTCGGRGVRNAAR